MAFAATGGGGVHFSFIVENNEVNEQSPVIMTAPENYGAPEDANFAIADNLYDFLRTGFHRGYFALEQLAWERDLALQAYSSSDWEPADDWFERVDCQLIENGEQVRDLLAKRLNLTPLLFTTARFESLQMKYKPLLEYPAEDGK